MRVTTTISVTLLIVSLVFSLFIKSILGVFGLSVISTETLTNLQSSHTEAIDRLKHSQSLYTDALNRLQSSQSSHAETIDRLQKLEQVMDAVKLIHEERKKYTVTEFKERASKRVLSTAAVAASVGTVGVATAIIGLEVYDYCETKKILYENESILYGTSNSFSFDTCLQEGKEDSKAIFIDLTDSSIEAVSAAINSTKEYSAEKWESLKQTSGEVLQTTEGTATDLWDFTRSWILSQ